MNWCIASIDKINAATNPALQQLKDWRNGSGSIRGVSHDDGNVVFIAVPDDLTDCDVLRVEGGEGALQVIGRALTNETHDLIVADGAVFTQLFYTPIHRLWCCNYDNKSDLTSDYVAVFGVDEIDGRKSLESLKLQVREKIKGVFA